MHKINPHPSPHYCMGFNFQESHQVLKMKISERFPLVSDRGRGQIIIFKSFQKFMNNKDIFFIRKVFTQVLSHGGRALHQPYLPFTFLSQLKYKKTIPLQKGLVKVTPQRHKPNKRLIFNLKILFPHILLWHQWGKSTVNCLNTSVFSSWQLIGQHITCVYFSVCEKNYLWNLYLYTYLLVKIYL